MALPVRFDDRDKRYCISPEAIFLSWFVFSFRYFSNRPIKKGIVNGNCEESPCEEKGAC